MTTARGACILGCAGPVLTAREQAFFRAADPFGFILFARNVETPDQLRRLTASLRDAVGGQAPVLIDQEGGRVQRLRAPHWREWLPPLDQVHAAPPGQAARVMALRYRLIAAELAAVGIDANCAPVADVLTPATHPFLRNRCYAEDPALVAEIAAAVAAAHLAMGVLPVVKHMPGHGRANADTHHDLPRVTTDAATLARTDFVPFRALNHLPMAMTAHVVFAAHDDLPATLSAPMIRVIREDIGFGGLLMTDDISMQALSGSVGARGVAAIRAGCDVILHCNGDLPEMEAVATAAGSMTPDATRRGDAALAARLPHPPLDLAATRDELASLTGGHVHG